jgi:Holliday junction resolvase
MNSKAKGKRGEREFAAFLRDQGFAARRGVQYAGNPDAPDVVTSLPYHVEVKRTEQLRLREAVLQADRDSMGKSWIVAHRQNGEAWLVTLPAAEFCRLAREASPPPAEEEGEGREREEERTSSQDALGPTLIARGSYRVG